MIDLFVDPMRVAVAAEYDTPEDLVAALRELRSEGYRRIDAYTPYRIEEVSETLELGRTRIPLIGFVAGLIGAAAGFLVQVYANTWNYPIDVGGRPLFSVPAFIPPTFEATILFAGCAIFVAMFFLSRMPEPRNPLQDVPGFERATVDRFWIGVDTRDDRFDEVRTELDLQATRPLRVVRIERPR